MDKVIELHDGRELGYIEYGDPKGKPFIYIHGHPGSRLEAGFLAKAAEEHGARLISVDQPGLGLSTYKPKRKLVDWPNDVVELADRLNISRFAVVGFSGGGPHALACACKIPERLTACGIVSGVGRSSPFISFLGQWLPWVILPLTRKYFVSEEIARRSMMKFTQQWPDPDRRAYAQPWVQDVMVSSLVEGFRQGTKGAAYEGKLISARNWGFQLEDVQINVYLWHGDLDNQVPILEAKESAKKLPHCLATYYPNDGHISTMVNHSHEIIASMHS